MTALLDRLRLPAARDFVSQGGATYVASLTMFVRAILLAAILAPSELGIVAAVSLLTSLAQYADLGVGAAMEQRIPELSHDGHQVRAVQRTGYLARLMGSILFSVAVAIWLLIVGAGSQDLVVGLVVAAALFPVQAVQFSQQAYLRATREFGLLARLVMTYGLANLLLSVIAGLTFGFVGVVVAQLIVTTGVVGYASHRGVPFRSGWGGLATATYLLRLGWPLTLLAIASYLLIYVDQMLAGAWFGQAALGTYSLVTGLGTMLYFVPMAVASVIAPRLLRAYADRPDVETLTHYGWRPTEMLRVTMPALVGGAWLAVWFLFTYVLPEYAELGLTSSYILLLAMYFLGVNLGPNATLIALRKHKWNVPIIGLVLALKLVVDWVLVFLLDGGVVALAWGSLVSFAAYLTVHIRLVARQLSTWRWAGTRAALHTLWPGAALTLFAVGSLQQWEARSLVTPVSVAAAGCALSAVLWTANRSFAPVGINGRGVL